MLYDFFYKIKSLQSDMNNSTITSMLSNAIAYMQANYTSNFTTKDLADMFNLSEPYFRSLFKKQMNITPTEYKKLFKNQTCM